MSLTLGLMSLPSSIQTRKNIIPFPECGNTKFSSANKKDNAQTTGLSLQLDYTRQALKQVVTHCSKLSIEDGVNRGSEEDDIKKIFEEVYGVLKSEILNDPTFEWTPDSHQWVQQMLDYNVPKGKLMRGVYFINNYKLLKDELSEDDVFDACVMAWCIKWFDAGILCLDDILDNSHTRRDEPCWYRLPKVGNIAINDAILLLSHIPKILKNHFGEKPYYLDLLDLFNEVLFQTTSGQLLDLTTKVTEGDLSNYTLHHFRRNAHHKTGYLFFYLPTSCALLMAGENLKDHVYMKDLILEMGFHFQIMNDYQDCYGNPEKTGKIGTDIEDLKCSWLIVKALELCNEEQKKILQEHYGKASPSDVAKVKSVYNEINLPGVYAEYESENFDTLKTCVEAQYPNKLLEGIFASFASYRNITHTRTQ